MEVIEIKIDAMTEPMIKHIISLAWEHESDIKDSEDEMAAYAKANGHEYTKSITSALDGFLNGAYEQLHLGCNEPWDATKHSKIINTIVDVHKVELIRSLLKRKSDMSLDQLVRSMLQSKHVGGNC